MKLENIKTIACIGAGTIGHSWVCTFLRGGFRVSLIDKDKRLMDDIPNKILANYDIFIKKGLLSHKELDNMLDRLEIRSEISSAVAQADFCIESVPEDINLKKVTFAEMDKFAPKHSILASSTSGQSMTEISQVTGRPEKTIIIHPLNPPHILPAVEVVRGRETSDETTALTVDLLKKVGKKPFVCMKEVPGFVMSRLLLALFREALSLLGKGVATVGDIDTAINSGIGLRFGLMGIFEVYNLAADGGLEMFLKNYSALCEQVWADFEGLRSISPSLIKKAVSGVKDELGDRPRDEILRWRDEKLLELLKIRELI
jgi:carnitine 3-dehydrogenase